jgi:hypothetical protein
LLSRELKLLLENYLILITARNSLKDEEYDGLPRNQNFIDRIMMLNKRYLDDREIEQKLHSVMGGQGLFDQFSVTRGSQSTQDRVRFNSHGINTPRQAEIIEVEGKGDSQPNKVLFTYLFPDDEEPPKKETQGSGNSNSQPCRKFSIHRGYPDKGQNVFALKTSKPKYVESASNLRSESCFKFARPDARISRTPKGSSASTRDRIFQLFAYDSC